MAVLSRWNRFMLVGWLVTLPALVFTYFAMWAGISVHGPSRADYWPFLAGLGVLVLCGVLGLLAAIGVGCRGGERPRGRTLGALLVPVGGIAVWVMVQHLSTHGLPD